MPYFQLCQKGVFPFQMKACHDMAIFLVSLVKWFYSISLLPAHYQWFMLINQNTPSEGCPRYTHRAYTSSTLVWSSMHRNLIYLLAPGHRVDCQYSSTSISTRNCLHYIKWNIRMALSAWLGFCYISIRHYNDVIMGTITCPITSLTIVFSTVYSAADQRKHQNSASQAFVREITGTGEFPAQMPVTRKMFPFDDVIMYQMEHTYGFVCLVLVLLY